MKRIISFCLAILFCIGICVLSACNNNNNSQEISSSTNKQETQNSSVETKAPTVESTSVPTIDTSEKKEYFLEKLDYLEDYSRTLQSSANSQTEMSKASKEIYDKYDELLNEVYSYLKEVMPEDKFSKIESDEKGWVIRRDEAIEEAGKQYAGGTMYGMVRSSAGAEETKKRINELLDFL